MKVRVRHPAFFHNFDQMMLVDLKEELRSVRSELASEKGVNESLREELEDLKDESRSKSPQSTVSESPAASSTSPIPRRWYFLWLR